MSRAVSIHIGVNAPRGRMLGHPLRYSENIAWRMAGLAEKAGYESLLVLRGTEATRRAVHDALTAAAGSMTQGDILLVSFAGHGCLEADVNADDGHGWDETWCLYDGEILDDQLAGYWRLFAPGVRIVVVADGCHSAGSGREDEKDARMGRDPYASRMMPGVGTVYRASDEGLAEAPDYTRSCIGAPPHDTDGIHASVLLLASAREDQKAEDGLFTHHLMDLWNEGRFPGTYCDLHRLVRDRVAAERGPRQEPQILMLGSPDPGFPLQRAFSLERGGACGSDVYR
ncbi:caspase family protein [Longimicrobium sp.]|uniref:caspase family protein n=1 Tax=Longimicrobium sp. TaxID=2029185 RepID=UPI003B3B9972